jgi:glycosyltransferase involved in cell wall biosynthesis
MKKLLIEASVLEQDRPSGVNYFADGLANGLENIKPRDLNVGYFWLNFLHRKTPHNRNTVAAAKRGMLQQIISIPQKIYAKLVYLNIAPPLWVAEADWLLFPNFYIWPTLRRSKKAVIIHDLCFVRFPEYVEEKNRAFLEKVAKKSIEKADLIISNSEFTTSELTSLLDVPKEKIVTLNIPVDESQFLPELDKGATHLNERYGIVKPYILSLGTLEPRKNLSALVDAYCLLPEDVRERYSLVLAGKWGWKIESLRALIDEKRAAGYDIITTGHIDHDDKATFYRNASFYAITTHYEGFGMPLLEALHCGIPTVAVDIPVLREVGDDACLWATKDPADVSEKINHLINSPDLAHDLSVKGVARAKHFSWEETAKKLASRLG